MLQEAVKALEELEVFVRGEAPCMTPALADEIARLRTPGSITRQAANSGSLIYSNRSANERSGRSYAERRGEEY